MPRLVHAHELDEKHFFTSTPNIGLGLQFLDQSRG